MTFFNESNEAKRYAESRPYFHPLAIARARAATGITTMVPLALDVACGTGQSAIALTSLAERVIGLDISAHMLANSERNGRIDYVQARAEALPLPNGSLSVMSTALAFHWFDRHQFLGEARRVLGATGHLLVYTNGFTGIMRENPAFQQWSQRVYPERFPTPPRNSRPLTPTEAADSGFAFITEERYENEVSFAPDTLVAYLTTQTNVVAAIDEGREHFESARQWLLEQVQSYFPKPTATFVFATRAYYLRKSASR